MALNQELVNTMRFVLTDSGAVDRAAIYKLASEQAERIITETVEKAVDRKIKDILGHLLKPAYIESRATAAVELSVHKHSAALTREVFDKVRDDLANQFQISIKQPKD